MFRQIRYQTGELNEIVNEMKNGRIPCMDVDDNDEMNWFIDQLELHGIYKVKDLPYDKDARDRIEEPEFEFRVAFGSKPVSSNEIDNKDLMYIDFYFEPFIEETYDSIYGD